TTKCRRLPAAVVAVPTPRGGREMTSPFPASPSRRRRRVRREPPTTSRAERARFTELVHEITYEDRTQ
ncbi:hypothetical protein, partial [Saccharothrix sp. Mg75]|uniref:hypothetical protein n=1 Tax=Saccharothrix sp. Mg75 TaxID=3445357 RepID=UPI003EEE8D52